LCVYEYVAGSVCKMFSFLLSSFQCFLIPSSILRFVSVIFTSIDASQPSSGIPFLLFFLLFFQSILVFNDFLFNTSIFVFPSFFYQFPFTFLGTIFFPSVSFIPFRLFYHLCGLVVRSRGPGFDSRRYQIFWKVVGLERGPLSLVSITEELLEWKSSGPGSRNRDYGRGDPLRWPRDTPY
jgi:hypothetical protein